MSKSSLEQLLKENNLYVRPTEPWKTGSNEPGQYLWICQPGPGAARQDAELLSTNDKSSVLMRTSSKREKSPKKKTEFVNDSSSFPELGGGKVVGHSRVTSPAISPKVAPPHPPPVDDLAADSGIIIDRVKGQVWGDWGLGPNGDPEASTKSSTNQNWSGSPQPKLIGAWK